MKKLLFLPILLLSIVSCNDTPQTDFTAEVLNDQFTNTDGQQIAFKDILSKYKGKVVVIDVWASWCPDCIKGMPKVHKLQEQFPDAVYLFLSYDKTDEAWKNGIDKYGAHGENYHAGTNMKEGAFSQGIKLDWIPRYMVLDKTGKIALFKAIEADDEKLITAIKNIK